MFKSVLNYIFVGCPWCTWYRNTVDGKSFSLGEINSGNEFT